MVVARTQDRPEDVGFSSRQMDFMSSDPPRFPSRHLLACLRSRVMGSGPIYQEPTGTPSGSPKRTEV